jgi:GNAT superfamily N-acetyltransferase
VRPAQPAELEPLAALLARAFEHDPVYRWILPDERRWQRGSPGLFRAILDRFAATGLVLTDDACAGAALWHPPDPPARPALAFSLRLALQLGRAIGRLARVAEALEQLPPRGPDWYLAVLGTAPERQRSGVATSLLGPILARCDAQGLAACLDTGNRGNVGFYERRGFEVIGEATLRGGPTLWAMHRAPRPRAPTALSVSP